MQAFTGTLLAVVVAGLRRQILPFDGSAPPLGLGITGSSRPSAVAWALWRVLAEHPVVIVQACVLAAAAVALPYLRGRGPWPAAIAGAVLLAATALGAPLAAFLPLAAAAWITAAYLALSAGRGGGTGARNLFDEQAVGPHDQQDLAVPQARDGADLLARRVVDPDLRADVALRVDVDPADVPTPGKELGDLVRIVEPLVRDRDEQPRRPERREQLGEGRGRAALGVVGAPPLAAVDALVGDAVALGRIPADEGLPDVVVGEERVLVVRRVDVDEVDVELGREDVGVEPGNAARGTGDRLGKPERRARCRSAAPRP